MKAIENNTTGLRLWISFGFADPESDFRHEIKLDPGERAVFPDEDERVFVNHVDVLTLDERPYEKSE